MPSVRGVLVAKPVGASPPRSRLKGKPRVFVAQVEQGRVHAPDAAEGLTRNVVKA
jgi:hypothetical protein